MQLAPFRVAGMDQSEWGMEFRECSQGPDGIPGEEVSRFRYDAYFKVEKFFVRLHSIHESLIESLSARSSESADNTHTVSHFYVTFLSICFAYSLGMVQPKDLGAWFLIFSQPASTGKTEGKPQISKRSACATARVDCVIFLVMT